MTHFQDQPWPSTTPVEVQVDGDDTPDIAEYAESRVRDVLGTTGLPVLHGRVRITRHANPARARPVVAQANVDVNGRLIRAQTTAPTAHEAVNQLRDRLHRRLQDAVERAAHRRLDEEVAVESEPSPIPPGERRIARHKTVTPMRWGVDEAAAYMDDLDYDFHLFTEAGTGQDSVLYRSGPTGHRLAQLEPQPAESLAPHTLPLTTSEHTAPRLSVREATERMGVWTQPFLFFRNADHDRGAVLYVRHDGHYGLITPTP